MRPYTDLIIDKIKTEEYYNIEELLYMTSFSRRQILYATQTKRLKYHKPAGSNQLHFRGDEILAWWKAGRDD